MARKHGSHHAKGHKRGLSVHVNVGKKVAPKHKGGKRTPSLSHGKPPRSHPFLEKHKGLIFLGLAGFVGIAMLAARQPYRAAPGISFTF